MKIDKILTEELKRHSQINSYVTTILEQEEGDAPEDIDMDVTAEEGGDELGDIEMSPVESPSGEEGGDTDAEDGDITIRLLELGDPRLSGPLVYTS